MNFEQNKLSLFLIFTLILVSAAGAADVTFADDVANPKVLSLDGDGDYSQVADNPSLDLSTQLTVEGWSRSGLGHRRKVFQATSQQSGRCGTCPT